MDWKSKDPLTKPGAHRLTAGDSNPLKHTALEEKDLVNFYYSLLTEKIDGSNYTRDILQQHFDLCVVDFMRSLPQRSGASK